MKVEPKNNLNASLLKISEFFDECLQLETGPKQSIGQCVKV